MKVVKNYLWNVSYQIFVIIVPMITMPYISRVLGPHGVGVNSFTNSIVQYFVLFGGLGLGLYGNREIAYVRDNKKQLSKEFWELLILRTVTMTSSLVIYIIMAYNWREYRGYLFIQSIQIIAAIIDISWFFMGIENFRITVLRNLLVKSISVICIFLFVKSRNDTGIYIAILALSTLFGNFLNFQVKCNDDNEFLIVV
ncbi:oligosaccharide flippase family protein [Lacticaseibacillus paracasei]|uniref:oligosaccharide flippase family protein n=1 Tax=Lacticaseibacillus paracasei TaxID=1597 RepID=UPI001CDCBBFE|nr:oligosaccharide flippase family protein [Lacticaseibacillus paracasei]